MYQISLYDIISNPYFLFSLFFWIAIIILVYAFRKKRETFELLFPFLFMARTKRFNNFLTKIGQKWPRFWKVFWTIGIFVSFGFLVYGMWFFTSNLISLIVDPGIENAIIPLIPGVTVDFFDFITYLMLPILFVITLHEFGHGVAATAEKLELKSTGVFAAGAFFIVGFGAFVEPNERAFKSRKFPRLAKLRIATAGTYVNAIEFGIAFLLILSFPALMSLGYSQRYFAIQTVSTTMEGGFNEGNLVVGEVCVEINGTAINLDTGPTLNDILMNKTTPLRCSPGDTLVFKCYQPSTKTYIYRTVQLGPRNFVGFTVSQENDTAAQVETVYTLKQGGNNDGTIQPSWIITGVNGTSLNYTNKDSFEHLVTKLQAGNKVNLTVEGQGLVEINVNYLPTSGGAFVFNSTYLGFTYSFESSTSVRITYVFSSTSEYGNNEGNIKAGDIITKVGNYEINPTQSLAYIIDTLIRPAPDQHIQFTTNDGRTLTLLASAIPVIPVYIGIVQEDYWIPIPGNFFTEFLGPTFPSWVQQEFYYFWMVAFSVTMFNMLPAPIFDGNRVVSEIIDWIVEKIRGPRFRRKKRESIRMQFDEKTMEYNFPEAEVLDVERVSYETDPQFTFEKGRDFKLLNSWNSDSSYDGLSFDIPGGRKPINQETLLVDYVYSYDENQSLKKWILWTIWIYTAGVIIANFIISWIKFGNLLFWV